MIRLLPLSVMAVLIADQLVKVWVVATRGVLPVRLWSFVQIRTTRTQLTLAARIGVGPALLGFVWTGSLVAALLIHTGGGSFQAPLSGAGLGMAPGGAGGNVLDLLVRKAVIDYVEIGAWPAFNLADVAIVAGVILALVSR